MSILSPQSNVLPNIAAGIAAVRLGIGLSGLTRPLSLLPMVDFPVGSAPESRSMTIALTRMFCARNIELALFCFMLRAANQRKLLGYGMFIYSFSAVMDGFVSLELIGGGAMNHWPFALIATGIGAGLVGWLG